MLSEHYFLDQMHDEKINEITINKNEIALIFNELHFLHTKKYSSAKILFKDLEDVNCDAYVRIFVEKQCIIEEGIILNIDEFIKYLKKEKIKLEVIDILQGYDLIMIVGCFVNIDNSYRDERFQLVVSTEKVSYIFSD